MVRGRRRPCGPEDCAIILLLKRPAEAPEATAHDVYSNGKYLG